MSTATAIQYLTDDKGVKTAVVVPIQTWNDLLPILEQYHSLKESVQRGLEDVRTRKQRG